MPAKKQGAKTKGHKKGLKKAKKLEANKPLVHRKPTPDSGPFPI